MSTLRITDFGFEKSLSTVDNWCPIYLIIYKHSHRQSIYTCVSVHSSKDDFLCVYRVCSIFALFTKSS